MTDVIGYIRVSTLEQAESGLGLEAQRQTIELECDRRQWRLVAVFTDAGASGKSLDNRPALTEALSALKAGRGEALVVAKLDRLSRSLIDFCALMEDGRRRGWALVALDLGVDTTTPAGEMVANVMASFAQFERRLIGQRTKEALAVKRAAGVRLGRPPAVSDDLVARLANLRAEGLSYRAIADVVSDEGWPTGHGAARWSGATVRYILVSSRTTDMGGVSLLDATMV